MRVNQYNNFVDANAFYCLAWFSQYIDNARMAALI